MKNVLPKVKYEIDNEEAWVEEEINVVKLGTP